jgi:uncharacterized protein YacL
MRIFFLQTPHITTDLNRFTDRIARMIKRRPALKVVFGVIGGILLAIVLMYLFWCFAVSLSRPQSVHKAGCEIQLS